jgi:hypothetical protein
MFGISKQAAIRLVRAMIHSLREMANIYIQLPEAEELSALERSFSDIAGFPGAVLAIDGSLIEIERPSDFEGWYCRKGYPAMNVQLVVDHRKRVRSFSIRPGSANDQSMFNRSTFAIDIEHLLHGTSFHVLGDAGYRLLPHMLTPFDITPSMTRGEAVYNRKHSRTRIVVECAIGLLKGRFRRLKMPLNQKDNKSKSDVIVACLVLHNLLIDLHDSVPVDEAPDNNINHVTEPEAPAQGAVQKRLAIMVSFNT